MTAPLNRRRALLGAASSALSIAIAACGGDRKTAAQTPTGRGPRPAVAGGTLGLGIIGLFVADLDRSLDFYRRLGLDIPDNVDTSGGSFRLRMPNDQIFFWETFAYTRRDFPDYHPARGDRKVALEFGFASPKDVDAMYATLTAAGARSYFEPTQWGDVRIAIVVDPDDNQIALRFPLVS